MRGEIGVDKSTSEMIYETNRDVKWICKTLQWMEEQDTDFETRLRALEDWYHTKIGEEQRTQRIGASAGGLMGGVVAGLCGFCVEGEGPKAELFQEDPATHGSLLTSCFPSGCAGGDGGV